MSVRKPTLALVLGVPVAASAILAGRVWVTGTAAGALATRELSATGTTVVPAMAPILLVQGAAIIAMLSAGRIGRILACALLAVAAWAGAALSAQVAANPAPAIGVLAAQDLGRVEPLTATGTTAPIAWVVVGALALEGLLALAALRVVRGLGGLGSRFDAAPAAAHPKAAMDGSRAGRTPRDDWDDLTQGRDPTIHRPEPPAQ